MTAGQKPRVATVWLGGCSGCHMSFLDMDERLLDLAPRIDVVFSPVADIKIYPKDVDVVLVEGAVANHEHEEMAHTVRKNSAFVVSFGDCATTGNVTSLRNSHTTAEMIRRSYVELSDAPMATLPVFQTVAELLPKARPLHEVIDVNAFLHGCPPTADQIWYTIQELLAGRTPVLPPAYLRYG